MNDFPLPHPHAVSAAPSPFAGADVCGLAGFVVPLGARGPVFEDDLWDFTHVIGIPAYVSRCARRLDFSAIANPRWKTVAKEYVAAQMAPGHDAVRTLPHANRTVRAIGGLYAELLELVRWLNWLTAQGIDELGEVTEHHCVSFAQYRATHRPNGTKTRDRPSVRRMVELVIIGLARYGELFTMDRYDPGLRPFAATASEVSGGKTENKTQPVPDTIFQPMLAAALYLVQTIAPLLLRELAAKREGDARRASLPRSAVDLDALREIIRRHVEDSGSPSTASPGPGSLGSGWPRMTRWRR
ncbi:hypothetical protein ABT154_09640 [Streptomyces sp. NPDC001728]|uniref:hypothetical protein n=1 Tax=Streptomyces sp. NPDC001728 TaxID=3154396 RepID=UPI00332C6B00